MSIEIVKKALSKKYEFIKLIGKGGFAEVYLAKDKILEREVAIKILLTQHAGDAEVVERFIREARLYAKFDQKNLIPIYETGIVTNNAFLVMKYVNGNSLKDIIEKKGTLNPDLILKVVKGMASALNYIHGKGIIHRDIKPANILIENDTNRVYLADFGIARPISSKTLTQTGMLIGTPYYISPEQIKTGTADKRSDIYALGTTLYELISGKPVFKCETPIEILYKHVNEAPKPIASINPNITMEMKHIVEKCLEKDPENRFQNANEILDFIKFGKTKQIYTPYIKKKPFFNRFIFKISFSLIIILLSVFSLYHFTTILDFLKSTPSNKKNIKESFLKKSNLNIQKEKKNLDQNLDKKNIANKTDINQEQKKPKITSQSENIVEKKSDLNSDRSNLEKAKRIEISKTDKTYNEFFNLSKKNYEKGNYILAQDYLKKAKKEKETLELFQLSDKIKKELKKIPVKKETKPTVQKEIINKVSLFKLNPQLTKDYMLKIDKVRITITENPLFFINKVDIKGQLTLIFQINEFGKLTFQKINRDNLSITPIIYQKKILRYIWIELKNISFQPPVDKNGNRVILEKWRVTFIVSKFKNKIILRKV